MDTYGKGPDARRAQPGGSEDPASRPPEGGPDAVEEPPPPVAGAGDPPPLAPRGGVGDLSPRYRFGAALTLAVVAVAACAHLAMVFLHVAPANTLTRKHGTLIDAWIYPEFEQNWKLFAPNPLQQNIDVEVRAEVSTADGGVRTTGWYDLSALDGAAIDGNPLPSHTQQNELRRAWDFYTAWHDGRNRPTAARGSLAEDYLRRLVALRLHREHAAAAGERLDRVQVRSRVTDVPPPAWSGQKASTTPVYRMLPWWSLRDGDTGAGA
ncbi:DUF5819 family protein [Streptomyces sp. NPDC048664]|uniref:DUF5819 family protein n=1 Tax=Streptomyces sp. NPDC048664 TaxID=3154505 RepID=UPI00344151F9